MTNCGSNGKATGSADLRKTLRQPEGPQIKHLWWTILVSPFAPSVFNGDFERVFFLENNNSKLEGLQNEDQLVYYVIHRSPRGYWCCPREMFTSRKLLVPSVSNCSQIDAFPMWGGSVSVGWGEECRSEKMENGQTQIFKDKLPPWPLFGARWWYLKHPVKIKPLNLEPQLRQHIFKWLRRESEHSVGQ